MSIILNRAGARLLAGTALILAMQIPSFAHAGETADDAAATLADIDQNRDASDIVVSGQRQAIKKVQDEQLDSKSLVTIVSGEELRAQPQQNLADLLTRIPGLSSSVSQGFNMAATGEAQYVSIRGLDTSYNAYQFDGVRLAQTDQNNRAISMNLLSPFSLAEVRVDKAPTAAQDGDAIAGIINFVTASPFALPDHYFQVRTQGQVNGRAAARDQDSLGGTAQIETAQTFGNFGVYASAYYGKKNVYGEATTMHKDYVKYDNNVPGSIRDNLDNAFGRGVSWNVYQNRIERFGGTMNLEYKGDAFTLYSRSTYGEYRLKSWMDQTAIRQVDLSSNQINPNPGGGMYEADGYVAIYGVGGSNYFRTEHNEQRLFTTKLGGDVTISDRASADFYGAYSKGRNEYPFRLQAKYQTPAYIGGDNTGTATFQLVTSNSDAIAPRVVLDDAARAYLTDFSNFKETYSIVQFQHVEESKGEGAVNFHYKLADQGLSAIHTGAKFETSDRGSNGINEALEYDFSGDDIPTLDQAPGELVTEYMHGGAQIPFFIYDHDYIEGQARELSLSKLATVDPDVLNEQKLDGTEQRLAGYITADLTSGGLSVVPGVRFEHNRFKATYWQSEDDGTTDTSHFVTSTKSYNQWLPSVIASYRPDDSTVYRLSVRKSYTRPAFGLLVGPTNITYDVQTIDGKPVRTIKSISVPNPDLDVTTAWNVDGSLEIAGSGTDFFSVAAYYKRLSHIWFATSTDSTLVGIPSQGSDNIEVTSNDSSGKGDVYGVELFGRYSFKNLPGVFDGLGLQASLTLQRADATIAITRSADNQPVREKRRMPQAPQVMLNAELFYNHGPVSAALNYNYSGNKLADVRNPQPDTYMQPVSMMNFTANYSISERFTVGVAVENLLNASNYWATYGENSALLSVDRSGGYIETGRNYFLNLSYRM